MDKQARSVPAPTGRMSLQAITKGKLARPIRVLLYGVEGIGKSTFGACAPGAIFICAEDGTAHLDVARFPAPQSWADILDALRVLATQDHTYRTVVIDTVDWLEPMLWDFICARDKKSDIEDYGYGKGYVAAMQEWQVFLAALDRVYAKGMNVILLGHSWVKPFNNPAGLNYDRYELKINLKAAARMKEWPDAVLFAAFDTVVAGEKTGSEPAKKGKGVSTGKRLIHTVHTAAWDAKNRFNLPETMPLDWEEFFAVAQAQRPADPAALEAACREKAGRLPDDFSTAKGQTKADVVKSIEGMVGDADRLTRMNTWLNAKLDESKGEAA